MPSGQKGIVPAEVSSYARLPHLNPLPLAGEEAEEKGNF
jgi:hypothetical protein